jgi:hypothetical protein
MSDNVKALPEIDLSLVSLRQAIENEYRTYETSLHQAIRAAERCGFQDGCAVAALGWDQWLIRRRSFLPTEGV